MKRSPLHPLTLAVLAVPAAAQTPLVTEGDQVGSIGLVTRIDDVFVNSNGDWIVEVDTDNSNTAIDAAVIENGVVVFQEGTDLGLPVALNATLSSMDVMMITDGGNRLYLPRIRYSGSTANDGVLLWNGNVVIQEDTTPMNAPGAPAAAIWEFVGEAWANDANQILVVGGISGALDVIALVTHDGTGTITAQQLLAIEGVQLAGPNHFAVVQGFFQGRRNNQINQSGDVLWLVDDLNTTPGGASNNNICCDSHLYLNSTMIVHESDPVPFDPTTVWGTLSSTEVDLNDNGDWVMNQARNPNEFNLDVIVKNGTQLIAAEGQTLPSITPWAFTALGPTSPTKIDNGGNVWFYGDWNDPNLDVDTGIFRNQDLYVQEGVSEVNGVIIDTIVTGDNAYEVSRNGRYLIVEVVLADGTDMAVLYDVNASLGVNYCGPAVANSSGNSATIRATGSTAVVDNDLTLSAEGLALNAFSFFIVSRTQGFVANPGGSTGNLCLAGAVGRAVGGQIINSGATGIVSVQANLTALPQPTGPVAVVVGETWNFQCWFRDAVGGAATSNFSDAVAVTFN